MGKISRLRESGNSLIFTRRGGAGENPSSVENKGPPKISPPNLRHKKPLIWDVTRGGGGEGEDLFVVLN